jgi:hypothetical protein
VFDAKSSAPVNASDETVIRPPSVVQIPLFGSFPMDSPDSARSQGSVLTEPINTVPSSDESTLEGLPADGIMTESISSADVEGGSPLADEFPVQHEQVPQFDSIPHEPEQSFDASFDGGAHVAEEMQMPVQPETDQVFSAEPTQVMQPVDMDGSFAVDDEAFIQNDDGHDEL